MSKLYWRRLATIKSWDAKKKLIIIKFCCFSLVCAFIKWKSVISVCEERNFKQASTWSAKKSKKKKFLVLFFPFTILLELEILQAYKFLRLNLLKYIFFKTDESKNHFIIISSIICTRKMTGAQTHLWSSYGTRTSWSLQQGVKRRFARMLLTA